jgi:esterase/lipase
MGRHLVKFNAGGYTLLGRLYGADKNSRRLPAALFLRGWSPGAPWTPMDLLARLSARKLGIVCFSVQFRGMGSPGDVTKMTRANFLSDALASYDYLSSLDCVDGSMIIAIGESFGSYMASVLSAQRNLKGLLLRVPTDFPAEGFEDKPQVLYAMNRSREWKLRKHEASESCALDAVSRFQGSILIVESECDEFVPHQTIENYISAAGGKADRTLMKGAGHGLVSPFQMMKFYRLMIGWLGKKLAESE